MVMSLFRVWAPKAKQLEVEVRSNRFSLSAGENGWWFAEMPSVQPGTDYVFVLDGHKHLPDPRSHWQPQGVDGPSRTVDHGAFSWTDRRWQAKPLSASLFYELHIGTFTPEGTFKAAIEKLDHLVRLGITHVELMPVAEFSGNRGWGYDGVYPFAPHHAYGSPDDLKLLVDACHAHNLAIVLDVVYNHLGPAGNYLDYFGPYFTDRYVTPWGSAVNFDGPFSDEVRRFFCDNALMWLGDYHFDGLRLDAVHAIIDTLAMHFLEQLTCEVADLEAHIGRHLSLIAESDLQTHDQIGNRANGERSSHLMSRGHLKIGAALVLTAPFVPLLFQGEEWGASSPFLYFTDHQDSELARAVTEGRRREFAAFGWRSEDVPDPQGRETFERSKLNWREPEEETHNDLFYMASPANSAATRNSCAVR
jgi:1,4-alpha-glucan branching enzyme